MKSMKYIFFSNWAKLGPIDLLEFLLHHILFTNIQNFKADIFPFLIVIQPENQKAAPQGLILQVLYDLTVGIRLFFYGGRVKKCKRVGLPPILETLFFF